MFCYAMYVNRLLRLPICMSLCIYVDLENTTFRKWYPIYLQLDLDDIRLVASILLLAKLNITYICIIGHDSRG